MESSGFARMMAHSIAGRSQAPEKVTVTDLFYLRGLDVESVNIYYLWPDIGGGLLVGGKARLLSKAWVPARLARQEGDAGGVAKEASLGPGSGDEDEEMPQAVTPPPRTHGERIS
nr:hypothetical protein [Tanacetum cinerariifolium]